MDNSNLITIKELVQIINSSGFRIGERKIIEMLHEWEMIWVTGLNRKEPTNKALKSGYLKKGEVKGMDKYGREQTTIVVLVTKKGQEFIVSKLQEK